MFLAERDGLVPDLLRAGEDLGRDSRGVDLRCGIPVHSHHLEERLLVLWITCERTGDLGDPGRLLVSPARHQRSQGSRDRSAHVAVVGDAAMHQQGAEIRVAKTERPELVRVLLDARCRVARVPNDDLHSGQNDVDRVLEAGGVELAFLTHELHEVQRRQVAGAVVEIHVLGARIRCVDPPAVLRGVPAVDGIVELHSRIAATVRRFGDLAEQVAGPQGVHGVARGDRAGGPVFVVFDRSHEGIADPHAVVRVLVLNGRVGLPVQRAVVARFDQGMGLLFLAGFAIDEIEDVRMIHVEDHHLGGPPGLAATADDAGEGVVSLHEGNRPGSAPAA